jgi:hypothetical protein
MSRSRTILVLSDVHYACAAEKQRRGHETRIIPNPLLRLTVKTYRHFIWQRDPFAHNHLLDDFLARANAPALVVANGDYSCDTRFVGVSDDAACESARQCLSKLRQRFGSNLRTVIGDHELGKMSLFGGKGGLRLASWQRAQAELQLMPFWQAGIGNYVLLGITSSLVALPVYEPETLPSERDEWRTLRAAHLQEIRRAFAQLKTSQRILLFCHDPTALPFLWDEVEIRARLGQVEQTVIGHLHSDLFFWKSRVLAGMPTINFFGTSIKRIGAALKDASTWRHFKVRLCPSLAGIELLKDGGFYSIELYPDGHTPALFQFHPLPRKKGKGSEPVTH